MIPISQKNNGLSKVLGRITTIGLIGLVVLTLVAYPYSFKDKSGWFGSSPAYAEDGDGGDGGGGDGDGGDSDGDSGGGSDGDDQQNPPSSGSDTVLLAFNDLGMRCLDRPLHAG